MSVKYKSICAQMFKIGHIVQQYPCNFLFLVIFAIIVVLFRMSSNTANVTNATVTMMINDHRDTLLEDKENKNLCGVIMTITQSNMHKGNMKRHV